MSGQRRKDSAEALREKFMLQIIRDRRIRANDYRIGFTGNAVLGTPTMFPFRLDRHRVVIGTQLRSRDANGVVDRATPDVKVVLDGQKPSSITHGYIRATLAHAERQQREADQEAENQRNGDYAPVFLKPNHQSIDGAFYEGRKPPKLEPGLRTRRKSGRDPHR